VFEPPVRDRLIDRAPQHLPVPIGDLRPHRQTRLATGPVLLWRRRGPELLAAVGLLLAVVAVMVTVTRPALAVYLQDDAVHVGDLTLTHPRDNGGLAEGRLYTGAVTLLMVDEADGSVVASSVAYLGKEPVTGVCTFGPPTDTAIAERCLLRIGGASVTCRDVLRFATPGSWERRCSDGQELTVAVPKMAEVIPMPFPLAR